MIDVIIAKQGLKPKKCYDYENLKKKYIYKFGTIQIEKNKYGISQMVNDTGEINKSTLWYQFTSFVSQFFNTFLNA